MLYRQMQQDFLSLFSRDHGTHAYFDPIDGLRAIANLAILTCHSLSIFSAFVPSYPHIQWHEYINSQGFFLAPLMTLALEIFFLLSSFLLTHKLITQWIKDDYTHQQFLRQYPKLILKRVLRFWPGICFATILMFICGEPIHPSSIKYLAGVWLFFQNYVHYENWLITLSPLWTISLDMQIYVFLPILLFIFYSCRKSIGVFHSLTIFLLLSIIRAAIVFDPTTMPIVSVLSRYNSFGVLIPEHSCLWLQSNYNITLPFECQTANLLKLFMEKMYFPLEARFGSFIIGALLAIKLCHVSSERKQNGTWKKYFFFSLIVCHMLMLVTRRIDPSLTSHMTVRVSIATSRQIFAIGQAFILFTALCPPSHPYHARWIRQFLSSPIWIPISKLSYLVYIIHWPISFQLIFGGPLLLLRAYSVLYAALISVPIILVVSQVFSSVWFLFIEKPFERIVQKYFYDSKSNKIQ